VMDETNGKILALNIGRGLVFLNKIKKLWKAYGSIPSIPNKPGCVKHVDLDSVPKQEKFLKISQFLAFFSSSVNWLNRTPQLLMIFNIGCIKHGKIHIKDDNLEPLYTSSPSSPWSLLCSWW
jgi:hypothetical protein